MTNIKNRFNAWVVLSTILVSGILIPLFFVLSGLFNDGGEMWPHFLENLLFDYLSDTFLLIIGVGSLSVFFGVSSAWMVANYNFPGKRIFEFGLILPLAIPSYIAAYTYAGIFDFTGIVQQTLRAIMGDNSPVIDIMNLPSICIILAFVLYPYVYIISRASFLSQSKTMLEVARSLGTSPWQTFMRVGMPLSRPAIIGGVSLVLMEVLNDYGAVKYFGISTFTTGIFRAWFSLGEANLALRLAAILLVVVFVIFFIEKQQRAKLSFSNNDVSSVAESKETISSKGLFFAYIFCGVPFLFGFLIPTTQLIVWASDTYLSVIDTSFFILIKNSFLLALVSSFICVLVSVIISYSIRWTKSIFSKVITQIAVIGYAIPGAVIAIGILIPFTSWNILWSDWIEATFNIKTGLFLSEFFISITFAYLVRFLAVSYNSVDSGFSKVSIRMSEASRSLGKTPFYTLLKIDLPLIKWQLLAAFIMVFIDVLKELPLTLILRPFNYHSLATRTYEYAGDEMIHESAVPALVIILLGIGASVLLNNVMKKR